MRPSTFSERRGSKTRPSGPLNYRIPAERRQAVRWNGAVDSIPPHPSPLYPVSDDFDPLIFSSKEFGMSAAEAELLELSRTLLTAIDAGDWSTYAKMCDESITCFEPEALGHLVTGLPFHKYYFDLPAGKTPKQSTIASPSVRIIGDAAVVTYVRVVQKLDGQGSPLSAAAMETRIWQKTAAGWKHIHFHRSPQ